MESKTLTREEFASLLTVGNTSAVIDPPAVIPAEHRARLIALGFIADLYGRLTDDYARQGANRSGISKHATARYPERSR